MSARAWLPAALALLVCLGPAPVEAKPQPPADEPLDGQLAPREPAPRSARSHVDPDDPRTRLLDAAPFDLAGGGGRPGDWAVELSGGWPWSRLRAQASFVHGLTPIVEFETALGRRFRPALGLGLRWLDKPHVRISGEAMLGWLFVTVPELRKRGPQGELRLRLAFPVRRVAPYLTLATRHTLLSDRTTIERLSGTEVTRSYRHNWTGWASLGVVVAITEQVGVELGIDYPWVDYPTLPIPGFHAGVMFGDIRGRGR